MAVVQYTFTHKQYTERYKMKQSTQNGTYIIIRIRKLTKFKRNIQNIKPYIYIYIYTHTFIHSFIHSVFCLTTGSKPPPKRFLHTVRSRASSLKWEYPVLSLRSSSSFLRLLPRLLVTSISPFIFPSITRFRRQFLHKMWPIQLAFRSLISCRIFLCSLPDIRRSCVSFFLNI